MHCLQKSCFVINRQERVAHGSPVLHVTCKQEDGKKTNFNRLPLDAAGLQENFSGSCQTCLITPEKSDAGRWMLSFSTASFCNDMHPEGGQMQQQTSMKLALRPEFHNGWRVFILFILLHCANADVVLRLAFEHTSTLDDSMLKTQVCVNLYLWLNLVKLSTY